MPLLSSGNIITHHSHVNGEKVDTAIGCGLIIGRYMMGKLTLISRFKCKVLEWDNNIVNTKDPDNFL